MRKSGSYLGCALVSMAKFVWKPMLGFDKVGDRAIGPCSFFVYWIGVNLAHDAQLLSNKYWAQKGIWCSNGFVKISSATHFLVNI